MAHALLRTWHMAHALTRTCHMAHALTRTWHMTHAVTGTSEMVRALRRKREEHSDLTCTTDNITRAHGILANNALSLSRY